MVFLFSCLMSNKCFEFVLMVFDCDKFVVVNMQGFELFLKIFCFMLMLVIDDVMIDFDQMLQNLVIFFIFVFDGGGVVFYYGVLVGFDQLYCVDGYVFYCVVFVFYLWCLLLYCVLEVYFNEQIILFIIEGLFKGVCLFVLVFELKLMGDYCLCSFVCQYQEIYFDFFFCWMEKEGMYYWFDYGGCVEKLIIGDYCMMYVQDVIKVSYWFVDEFDIGVVVDVVQGFVCKQKFLFYQVILQDFNYCKVVVELKVFEIVFENGFGDVMIYGENFCNEQEGKCYVCLCVEEIVCGGKLFVGDLIVVGLCSGYFMELV